jgi:hypothetical protein
MTTIRFSNSGFIFVDPASPLENIGWTATLLADSDYATIVAQVERYQELNYSKEYNDVGGGAIKLDLDDQIFKQPLPSGQTVPIREQEGLWQVYHNGILRGEFFAEDIKETTLEKDSNPRGVEIAGRGTGSVLERAVVLPLGMPTPTTLVRTYTGPLMAFYLQLLNEAKARGTITYVNPQFSATQDSAGTAWIDTGSYSVEAGANLLDLLTKWCDSVGKRWVMAPGFKLYIYPEEGNHREATVALSVYGDQTDSSRSSTRREIANYIAAQAGDKGVAVSTSSTSISRWGRREQWLSSGGADDISTAQIVANTLIKINAEQKTARTFSVVYDVLGGLIFQDYDVGDWVGVEVQDYVADTGFFDPKHVTAISVKIDNDNDVDAEVTFEGKFEVRARKLQRIIDKLGGSTVGGSSTQGSTPLVVSSFDLAQQKLSGLADVSLSSLLPGQALVWNGTRWVNANIASTPSAPTSLLATGANLSWTAPASAGSSPITDYTIQYRTTTGPGSWTTFTHAASTATSATVSGLTPGVSYDFQVAALSAVGLSPWSNTATSTYVIPAAAIFDASLLALSNGAAVATWPDTSGNGRNATQATSGSRPTFVTGAMKGQPVVRFTGTQFMATVAQALATLHPAGTYTLIAAVKTTASSGLNSIGGMDPNSGSARDWQFRFNFNGGSTIGEFIAFTSGGASAVTDTQPTTFNVAHVVSAVRDTTTATFFTDGVSGGSTAIGAVNTSGSSEIAIGSAGLSGGGLSAGFIGDIAYFAIYAGALSTGDRNALEAILTAKYI